MDQLPEWPPHGPASPSHGYSGRADRIPANAADILLQRKGTDRATFSNFKSIDDLYVDEWEKVCPCQLTEA